MAMWPFNRKDKPIEAGWETHPCVLPNDFEMGDPARLTTVWRCSCGRRWRLLASEMEYESHNGWHRYDTWDEVMAATPITEEEFQSLLGEVDGTD
jgi:hypothetical protein